MGVQDILGMQTCSCKHPKQHVLGTNLLPSLLYLALLLIKGADNLAVGL